MHKKVIGKTQIEISPLAFGANVFGWTVDEVRAFEILDVLRASGINFLDTADVYSTWPTGNKGGESETIIGKWLKRRGLRNEVIVATKVGMEMGPGRIGLSKAYITQAVEDSLRRLQTDYIDLYQAHVDDPKVPMEETLSVFADLIKQGKVRAIGASNYSAARLAEAHRISAQNGLPRYECLQPLYNLYDRFEYEDNLAETCQAADIGVINFFSLAKGFLSGKYRSEADLDKIPRGQRGIRSYLTERGFRILDCLDVAAREYDTTPACVAWAWLMSRPGVTAPIVSATSVQQLHEILGAVDLSLGAATIAKLNEASRA